MTLTITTPITSTCSPLPVTLGSDSVVALQLPCTTTAIPDTFDTRTSNPFVYPRVVQHVAAARAVTLQRDKTVTSSAVKPFLPAFIASLAPVTYIVTGHDNIKKDLLSRGPLLATMQVTQHFCDYWSHLLRRAGAVDKPYHHHSKEKTSHATIIVALLGWTKQEEWIVALDWGATTDALHEYGHNGCCVVKMGLLGLDTRCVGMLPSIPATTDSDSLMEVHRCMHPFIGGNTNTRKKPKVQVKAKVVLAHGDNKTQHPKSIMQKVSAGDIASITFMALTIAIVAIYLCFSLTRKKKRVRK